MRIWLVCLVTAGCSDDGGGVGPVGKGVGESCRMSAECEAPLDCYMYETSGAGICLELCETECDVGFLCYEVRKGASACVPTCETNTDCPASLPICKVDLGGVCGG